MKKLIILLFPIIGFTQVGINTTNPSNTLDVNGTIQRFDKAIAQNEINYAMAKTILYCYKKINKK